MLHLNISVYLRSIYFQTPNLQCSLYKPHKAARINLMNLGFVCAHSTVSCRVSAGESTTDETLRVRKRVKEDWRK